MNTVAEWIPASAGKTYAILTPTSLDCQYAW